MEGVWEAASNGDTSSLLHLIRSSPNLVNAPDTSETGGHVCLEEKKEREECEWREDDIFR